MSERADEKRLRAVVSEASGRDAGKTGLDADLVRELHLDSLAALRVLAAVEKYCDVRFPDERLSEFRTLRSILDFMAGRGKERSS